MVTSQLPHSGITSSEPEFVPAAFAANFAAGDDDSFFALAPEESQGSETSACRRIAVSIRDANCSSILVSAEVSLTSLPISDNLIGISEQARMTQ
jgi:hypothetical protein